MSETFEQKIEAGAESVLKEVETVAEDVGKSVLSILEASFSQALVQAGEVVTQAAATGSLANVGTPLKTVLDTALSSAEVQAAVAATSVTVSDITTALANAASKSPVGTATVALAAPQAS